MTPCLQVGNVILCRQDLKCEVVGHTRARKWCFRCCKRARHLWVRLSEILQYDEAGELINGYYEPIVKLECPTCGEDNTAFPGTE